MLAHRGKTGDDEGKTKEDKQTPQINLDHINCKNGGEKSHYARNSEWSTQINIKEDSESFMKTNQGRYGNNPPGGGGKQNLLVNV